jgi:hypothetical protein
MSKDFEIDPFTVQRDAVMLRRIASSKRRTLEDKKCDNRHRPSGMDDLT